MSTITEKLGTWFSAIAFAEAGEHETAMKMVGMTPRRTTESVSVLETLHTSFAAAAFAEADCPDMAREILEPTSRTRSFAEVVGLKGVRVRYARVPFGEESFLESLGLGGIRTRLCVVPL